MPQRAAETYVSLTAQLAHAARAPATVRRSVGKGALIAISAALAALAAATTSIAREAQPAPTLDVRPWTKPLPFVASVAFLPDGSALATEKDTGVVRVIARNGRVRAKPFARIRNIYGFGEFGLLGVAIDPKFSSGYPYVYIYYSERSRPKGPVRRHRLVRFTWRRGVGVAMRVLIDNIRAAGGAFHAGGALAFLGDDLLVTVGEPEADRFKSKDSQNTKNIYGKILRVTRTGRPVEGNPFGNRIFALGIRNSFGITVDRVTGAILATDNGPDQGDEVNLIVRGGNYGWPTCVGFCTVQPYLQPLWESGTASTTVPTGIVSYRGARIPALRDSIVFCNFKPGRLMSLRLDATRPVVAATSEYGSPAWLCGAPLVEAPDGALVFADLKTGRLMRVVGSR